MYPREPIGRREMLQRAGGSLVLASSAVTLNLADEPRKRPKVAAVITEFTFRSHAHVILENFLEPYYFNGLLTDPGVDVVSFYIDQFPGDRDMARAVAQQYGIKIYPTINGALCLGGSELAVDGVLSIAEHGNYPVNEKGQRQYPRKRFFDEIVAVMKRSRRSVPLFNDKHLSYRTDWAHEMYDTTQQLKIPLHGRQFGPTRAAAASTRTFQRCGNRRGDLGARRATRSLRLSQYGAAAIDD